MTDQPLDPAAIMAAHAVSHHCEGGRWINAPDEGCETYRLAAELAAARKRDRRVRAVRDDLSSDYEGDDDFQSDPVRCFRDALDIALAGDGQ